MNNVLKKLLSKLSNDEMMNVQMDGFKAERSFDLKVYNGKKGAERKLLWEVSGCNVVLDYTGNSLKDVLERDARSTIIATQSRLRKYWTVEAVAEAFTGDKVMTVDPNNISDLEDPEKAAALAKAGAMKRMAALKAAGDAEAAKAELAEYAAAAGISLADLVG